MNRTNELPSFNSIHFQKFTVVNEFIAQRKNLIMRTCFFWFNYEDSDTEKKNLH